MVTKTISVKRLDTPDGIRWRVRWCESGKDKSARHETKDSAEAHASDLRARQQVAREEWNTLTAYERNSLVSAYAEAKKRGVDIHKAILLASSRHAGATEKFGKAITELKTSRLNNGRDLKYVTNLGIVLNLFAKGKESLDVSHITLADVESFLDSKSLQYRPTLRGKLSTFFNFCVRRGYRADNPCDRLESIKVVKTPPSVFTIKQVETAIEWLKEHAPAGLPWFVLSTFCGLRPEEAEKTTKHDIHFQEGFVRIEAQTTKVRQRRVVYPRSEAMACLKGALRRGSLPLSNGERRWILSGRPSLRDALGFTVWPKDITRHTAASYWLASEVSIAHVAEMMGNSETVLKSHYKALVTRVQAVEFWEMAAKVRF